MPPRNPFYALVGLDFIEDQLNAVNSKLDQLLEGQRLAKETDMAESEEIDNLVQQVSANRDAVQSATMAMKGMLDRIAAQGQELADAIAAGGSDVSPAIRQAAEDIAANTAALQDAVPHIAHAIVKGTKAG